MAKKNNGSGCIGVALVLGAVFMMGRCSVDAPSPAPTPSIAATAGSSLQTFAAQAETTDSVSDQVERSAPDPTPELEREPEAEPRSEYVYYRNCSAARAAGAAPVMAGEPGYARRLDRDGDGIGCE